MTDWSTWYEAMATSSASRPAAWSGAGRPDTASAAHARLGPRLSPCQLASSVRTSSRTGSEANLAPAASMALKALANPSARTGFAAAHDRSSGGAADGNRSKDAPGVSDLALAVWIIQLTTRITGFSAIR